jgi:hypothetical protein
MIGNPITATDAERELLNRVAATPQFQKAKRLRELLLYIGERSLRDPRGILHEQEIGVEVFGRQPDYDTSHDTLVRVQVSQLRKKLHEYFAGEGRSERLVIEIPKGSYVPVFRPRVDDQGDAEFLDGSDSHGLSSAKTSGPPFREKRRLKYVIVGGAAIVLILLGLVWEMQLKVKSSNAMKRPTVDAFWRQLFNNGQPTNLVLSDITLIPFEKLLGRRMPLSEYESREFERLADENVHDPATRSLAKEVVNRVATSVSDVEVARDFGILASENSLPLTLMSARETSSELMLSQNSIVLGSWRANPWVGLFEDQMTFRTEYQESPPSVKLVNSAPLKGEEAAYQAEWRRYGYCRVTYLANPKHTGSALVISGSDVISTEAGGRFLTSESLLRDFRQKLGLKPGEPFPHFEILLRTKIVNNTVPAFELVAYRPHPR